MARCPSLARCLHRRRPRARRPRHRHRRRHPLHPKMRPSHRLGSNRLASYRCRSPPNHRAKRSRRRLHRLRCPEATAWDCLRNLARHPRAQRKRAQRAKRSLRQASKAKSYPNYAGATPRAQTAVLIALRLSDASIIDAGSLDDARVGVPEHRRHPQRRKTRTVMSGLLCEEP